MTETINKNILLALDIADTIHDMVHPKKNSKRRCNIEQQSIDDKIYNLELISNVFQNMKKYSCVYAGNEKINDCCTLKELNTYDKLKDKLKLEKVGDFEDLIVHLFNQNYDIIDDFDYIEENKEVVQDFIPGGTGLPPNLIKLNTIASIWDPFWSSNECKNFINQSDKFIKVIGTECVYLSNNEIKLSSSNVFCIFNNKFLSKTRNFSNSVNTLCTFAAELQTKSSEFFKDISKTNGDASTNVKTLISPFEKLVLKIFFQFDYTVMADISKKLQTTGIQHIKYEKGIQFSKFLLDENSPDTTSVQPNKYYDILFKLFDIKRSGDYGQITAAKEKQCYLATGDRLCYLRSKMENVMSILVKKPCNLKSLEKSRYIQFKPIELNDSRLELFTVFAHCSSGHFIFILF